MVNCCVVIEYLSEEHDKFCQLLVGFVGLKLKYLYIRLVVSVLLQKLEKGKGRGSTVEADH